MNAAAIDSSEAATYLRALAPDNALTFNTFQDVKPRPAKDPLTRVLHGPYERLAPKLAELNCEGAGVFVMVNRGDCLGRKARNVISVRAIFLDLDTAPLAPVLRAPVKPSIVCESSPGRFHAIWPVSEMPLSDFSPAQLALAERYGGDKCIKDLPRVLRVPGYVHAKGRPFISRIVECHSSMPLPWRELAHKLRLPRKPDGASERWSIGTRNNALFRFATGLRTQGLLEGEALARMRVANAERCDVPLLDEELREILRSVWKREVSGFALFPYSVLDREEFRLLSDAAKVAVLALKALQRKQQWPCDVHSCGRSKMGIEQIQAHRCARRVESGSLDSMDAAR